ncbi:VanZ family protein [Clostridium sp. CF011]|uniref:VanZ family protein n=1 Tax=Clostridium sp. CF011 TaxID=2843318 RepID=UPI00227C2AEE|nr:VanZ family protein [Clostridium sp. CF011]WAG69352.1 VanZ family protein [Clostridium sp. CF011]
MNNKDCIKAIKKVNHNTKISNVKFDYLVRKNAHFFVCLVLGILMINALIRNSVEGIQSLVLALLICILYAISDEVHQVFVPGRGAHVKDVIIDSAGAAMGLEMYLIKNNINTR